MTAAAHVADGTTPRGSWWPAGRRWRARRGRWYRTAAWYRVPAIAIIAVGVGIGFGRADVVGVAAPLLLGWTAALIATSPMIGAPSPEAEAELDPESFGSNSVDIVTRLANLDGVEFALVAQPGERTGPIGYVRAIPGGAAADEIRARVRVHAWGRTTVARPDTLGVGPDGLYLAGPVRRATSKAELILPEVPAIKPLRMPPMMGGWAGAHVSRRPGQGSDLVDLREFAPGDRLKSIHWRAYARYQQLYTRRTLSDADADLMCAVDLSTLLVPRKKVLPSGRVALAIETLGAVVKRLRERATRDGARNEASREEHQRREKQSSLDLTVSAVAALANAHLSQGDRVGFMTAAVPRRIVRPGTGDRQLQRIRHQLATLDDRRHRLLDVSLWGLRPGQIVLWFSPMVTAAAFDAAVTCHSRGHQVIVVDTAPLRGILRRARPPDIDHLRVLTVERELRFDRLRGRGIPVLSWDEGNMSAQMDAALAARRGRI